MLSMLPRRKTIRLPAYDYSTPGAYFVTICTHNRVLMLGSVADGRMETNAAGLQVLAAWESLPGRFPMVSLDAFVVMPNHVHGMLFLQDPLVAERCHREDLVAKNPTLGEVLRAFKSVSAVRVNQALGRSGQPLWQRGYYEHVVRTNKELDRFRLYIEQNQVRWDEDPENHSNA